MNIPVVSHVKDATTPQQAARRQAGKANPKYGTELRFSQRVWRIMLNRLLRDSVAFPSGWDQRSTVLITSSRS
jgi:hypothetical protein